MSIFMIFGLSEIVNPEPKPSKNLPFRPGSLNTLYDLLLDVSDQQVVHFDELEKSKNGQPKISKKGAT